MSTDDPTLLERVAGDRPAPDDDTDEGTIVDTTGIAARSTEIQGDRYELADSMTGPTFDDSAQAVLGGGHGRPRPREFWTAHQLGRTPPMELIKNVVNRQLVGGSPIVTTEDGEIQGASEDYADLVVDIYEGPHHQKLTFDNLLTTAISDLIDYAFAYWETVPTEDGSFPIAGFKPLPPLQIQHTTTDDGDLGTDPAFWFVPFKRSGGSVTMPGEATGLEEDRVIVMRHPFSARSDRLYGQSVATKVREFLELIIDVDTHQKRHYSDSQLPAGFLHFTGAVGDDKLGDVEDDIVEASGDPHDLVTVSTDGDATWIPVGESVVDMEAIKEQQWYYKLVLAAAGLTSNEINMVESSGFAKEVPALQRMLFKNVTLPIKSAVFDPQNADALPQIRDSFSAEIDDRLQLDIERFDPVQEQIERQETMDEWREKAVSLNELRGGIGRDATEFVMDVPELGGEVNVADLPRYVVDLLLDSSPEVNIEGGDTQTESGPPDFENDPVLSEREAFAEHGEEYDERVVKQLDDTVEVSSSFIESIAYARATEFMQITFDAPEGSATYWYANLPEWRFFNFLQSSSKGAYFNKYIRHTGDPGYPFARVD